MLPFFTGLQTGCGKIDIIGYREGRKGQREGDTRIEF